MLNSFRFIWNIGCCELRVEEKKKLCLNTFSDFNQRFFLFLSLFVQFYLLFFLVWTFSRHLFRTFFLRRFRESQRGERERKKRNVLSIFFRPMVERSFSAVSWQSTDRYGLFMSEHNVPLCQRCKRMKGFPGLHTSCACKFTSQIYCINCANQPMARQGVFVHFLQRLFRIYAKKWHY